MDWKTLLAYVTGSVDGIVKLLGMIVSPGNSRHFPDAIATDPTLRRPALYYRHSGLLLEI